MTEDKRLDDITYSTGMNLSKLWELVIYREACHAAVHGVAVRHDWVTELTQVLRWLLKKKKEEEEVNTVGEDVEKLKSL